MKDISEDRSRIDGLGTKVDGHILKEGNRDLNGIDAIKEVNEEEPDQEGQFMGVVDIG